MQKNVIKIFYYSGSVKLISGTKDKYNTHEYEKKLQNHGTQKQF